MRVLVLIVRGDGAPLPPEWDTLAEVVNGPREGAHQLLGGNEVHVWAVDPFVDQLPARWDLERRYDAGAAAVVRQIDACERFDVLVAGQTRLVSRVVRGLEVLYEHKRPRLVIRFSVFYGGRTIGSYGPEVAPEQAGYHLDCPRDYALLRDLLADPGLAAAVEAGDREGRAQAVAALNEARPEAPPLLVL